MNHDQSLALINLVNAYTRLSDLYVRKSPSEGRASTKDILEGFRETTDRLHDLIRAARFPGSANVVSVYEQWLQDHDHAPSPQTAPPTERAPQCGSVFAGVRCNQLAGHRGDHAYRS